MNKKILPLTLLLTGIALVGCNKSTEGQDRTYKFSPTSVLVNYNYLNMFNGDSINLTTFALPVKAYNASLVFVSSNDKVATVDETGKVTAIGNGSTTITIIHGTAEEGTILKKIPVSVTTKIKVGTALDKGISDMKAYQATTYPNGFDKVKCYQTREIFTYADGVLINSSIEDAVFVVCKSEAFFDIEETDRYTKTANGSMESMSYRWTFFTNEDYNSFLYHSSEKGNTRLLAPSQSYLGQDRVEALYHILDTLFSSQRGTMENILSVAGSTTELESYTRYRSLVSCGSVGDNLVTYTLVQNDYKSVSDYEDERYSDIPYGTTTFQDYYQNIIWDKGIARDINCAMATKYTVDGVNYRRELNIRYSIEVEDEVTLVYPVDKEYRQVDDLFDL